MKKITNNEGQALITLLFFVVIGFIVASTALYLAIGSTEGVNKTQNGELAYYIAETGAENAVLRLLRDPGGYTGETLTVNSGTAVTSVSGTSPYVITSTGKLGNFVRKIQVQLSYTNNILNVVSWKEIQ